jgi:RHS repeat-associated protein
VLASTYVYDRYGNRWQQNATAGSEPQPSFMFDANNHITGSNITYDAVGNIITDGSHTYTYDADGRIVKVDNGTTARYLYNSGGHRVGKSSAAGSFEYLLDLSGRPITELAAGSVTTNRTEVYAGSRHLATESLGTTYFAHADWQGTERVRTTLSGTVCESVASLPFGDLQTTTGSCDPSPLHFTGKPRDPESGLDDFGARHYSSTMGRFMTSDPLLSSGRPWAPQSWNRYAYLNNHPLSALDPTGLYDVVICQHNDSACNKEKQRRQREIANNLRRSLNDLRNRLDKVKDPMKRARLEHALNALGTEGDHNGVQVKFDTLQGTAAAHTDLNVDASTMKLSFTVTFDMDKASNGIREGLAINAAHEGTHIADDEDFRAQTTDLSAFQYEYRGYQTSAWAAQALGFSPLVFGGNVVWNNGWAAADRETLMDRGITGVVTSAPYNYKESPVHNPWPDLLPQSNPGPFWGLMSEIRRLMVVRVATISITVALVFVISAKGATSQSTSTPCPLPTFKSGQTVTVRGKIENSAHDMALLITGCDKAIVLLYAGDPDSGEPPETLVKNESFSRFDKYTRANYGKIGHKGLCMQCPMYEVEATLNGRFDIAPDTVPEGQSKDRLGYLRDQSGRIVGKLGFGHPPTQMYRLVIESVSNVRGRKLPKPTGTSTERLEGDQKTHPIS